MYEKQPSDVRLQPPRLPVRILGSFPRIAPEEVLVGVGDATGGFVEEDVCVSKTILLPATATVASPPTLSSTLRREIGWWAGSSGSPCRREVPSVCCD